MKYFIESILTRKIGFSSQIACIISKTYTQSPVRLAVGTRNKCIQVFTFNHKKSIQPLFAIKLEVTVPVLLGFVDNPRKDLYIFGLYNGYLYMLPMSLSSIYFLMVTFRQILDGNNRNIKLTRNFEEPM
jgi:hypothetical protein